jgi:membrane-associated phospholipid phosphatase
MLQHTIQNSKMINDLSSPGRLTEEFIIDDKDSGEYNTKSSSNTDDSIEILNLSEEEEQDEDSDIFKSSVVPIHETRGKISSQSNIENIVAKSKCKEKRPKESYDSSSHVVIENIDNQNNKKEKEINNNNNRRLIYEQRRIDDMIKMRIHLSEGYRDDKAILHNNVYLDKYINIYSKGLPHDKDGYVDMEEMVKLLEALESRSCAKLSKIKLGSGLKLVNPSAAWSEDIIGACSNTYRYAQVPSLNSDQIAAEMAELYCMAYARDIQFNQYHYNSIIEDCCNYLNSLKIYPQVDGKITPYNIFRGPMYGDLQGSYISQFLYRDIKMGGFTTKQKYATDIEGYDFMKNWDIAISAQNGNIMESSPPSRDIPRYIITGRDLACYVHSDEPYQAFYNTCIILMDLKVPMNPGIIKLMNNNPTEVGFVNLGKPDIQSLLTIIGRNALLAAWYIKWNTLFLRPESLGIEIERVFKDRSNRYRISPELLKNPILETLRSKNGNVLLPQAYPEGAPLHPSTPAGHAAIAGACATVLKFFFDNKYELDVYEPNHDGQSLLNTCKKTTVEDEINKLASNLGHGRMWAGIHYNMDIISGMKIGEKVAISCLKELIHRYPMDISVSFPSFNNKIITIEHKY